MKFTKQYIFSGMCLFLFACSDDNNSTDSDPGSTLPVELSFVSISLPAIDMYGDYGALWGHFNNDDQLDLMYMGHGNGPLMLEQQENNTFNDVTAKSGIKNFDWVYPSQADRHGGSCGDFNNDGHVDLFITHGAGKGATLGLKFDELLQGHGDFTFTDVTDSAGTLNATGRGRTGTWVDYNNDGWLDLYVANFDTDNVMYQNNGNGTFSDVTEAVGLAHVQTRAAWADYDLDGHVDVMLSWPLKLMRNNGDGSFEDTTALLDVSNVFVFGMAWGDVDNDGDPDLFVSRKGEESWLLVNEGDQFVKWTDEKWNQNGATSSGIAWGDFDNDADLDVIQVREDGYFILDNTGASELVVQRLELEAAHIDNGNGDAALADFNNEGLPQIEWVV